MTPPLFTLSKSRLSSLPLNHYGHMTDHWQQGKYHFYTKRASLYYNIITRCLLQGKYCSQHQQPIGLSTPMNQGSEEGKELSPNLGYVSN